MYCTLSVMSHYCHRKQDPIFIHRILSEAAGDGWRALYKNVCRRQC